MKRALTGQSFTGCSRQIGGTRAFCLGRAESNNITTEVVEMERQGHGQKWRDNGIFKYVFYVASRIACGGI